MVQVGLQDRPLTAAAVLVWSGNLPRQIQQILFDTADSVTSTASAGHVEPVPMSA